MQVTRLRIAQDEPTNRRGARSLGTCSPTPLPPRVFCDSRCPFPTASPPSRARDRSSALALHTGDTPGLEGLCAPVPASFDAQTSPGSAQSFSPGSGSLFTALSPVTPPTQV